MPSASLISRWVSFRIVSWAIFLCGTLVSIVWYRNGHREEQTHIEMELGRRAAQRFTLTQEILQRYEDSLFALSTVFTLDAKVTLADFDHVINQLAQRLPSVQAFEWAPLVSEQGRAATEASMQRSYPKQNFQFTELDSTGQMKRAGERPFYIPLCYIHPLRGNELALGYDLMTAPTRPFLERARAARQMMVSSQFRLVQETGNQLGLVMIWPVYRAASADQEQSSELQSAPAELFTGFLQCVFRVQDLLEKAHAQPPDAILDALYIDASETDPALRILYYRSAIDERAPPPLTEADFRGSSSFTSEHKIALGERDWRVLYRARPGWIERQYSATPALRSGGLILLSGLLAGIVSVIGRRTETIRREVDERTAELAESRRQFATLLHALPGMAYRATYDEQLTVLFASEGVQRLTGWTAADFVSGAVHFRDLIHPDDIERVRHSTRIGLQDRSDVEVEYRIRTRDGAEKWVLSRGRGAYENGGKPTIFEGLAIDITAQKNAETARLSLERQLQESKKLESIGLLAGGIAHDFNNLLSSILANASMTRLGLLPGSTADTQLRAVENASLRAAELCRQLLAYAGKGRFFVEPTDLTALIEDALPLLRISVGRQVSIEPKLARKLPPVMADTIQLRQIVTNLVLNAMEAMGERGGEITISNGIVHADVAMLGTCVTGAGLPEGNYVFLEVRDSGSGMSPDLITKIFDPFFTTKTTGRGLGLAAVLGIVRGHSAALHVESAVGRGSSFRVLLPPAKGAVPAAKLVAPAPAGRRIHSGNALVVEDEEQVRSIVIKVLQSFGFSASGAVDGNDGIAQFRQNPASFDFVLLDMFMPGLSGEQTLAALRAIRPDVRVLLMSGYTEGDILRRLMGVGPLAFIPKPFNRDALEQKIISLLG